MRPSAGPQPAAETSPLTQHAVPEVGRETPAWGTHTAARDVLLHLCAIQDAGAHLGGGVEDLRAQLKQPGGCRDTNPQVILP